MENRQFSKYIDICSQLMPDTLISRENLASIRDVADRFPIKLSTFFGFESRLAQSEPAADFSFHVLAARGGKAVLSGLDPTSPMPPFVDTVPEWKRVMAFARHWADKDCPYASKVDNIWLEFDIDTVTADTVPSFFFGPSLLDSSFPVSGSDAFNIDDFHDIAPVLFAENCTGDFVKTVAVACERLPDGARIFQLGAMLSRSVPSLRLCVRGIESDAIVPYLRDIGWEGDAAEIEALISLVCPLVDRIDLDFDIISQGGVRVGPKTGFELYRNDNFYGDDDKKHALFNMLVEKKLCLPKKRDGLIACTGVLHEWNSRDIWPKHLLESSMLTGFNRVSAIFLAIHHIKLVHTIDREPEAKAYLAFFHDWAVANIKSNK